MKPQIPLFSFSQYYLYVNNVGKINPPKLIFKITDKLWSWSDSSKQNPITCTTTLYKTIKILIRFSVHNFVQVLKK